MALRYERQGLKRCIKYPMTSPILYITRGVAIVHYMLTTHTTHENSVVDVMGTTVLASSFNLLNVSQLTESGFMFSFHDSTIKILHNGNLAATGTRTTRVYFLDVNEHLTMIIDTLDIKPLEVWHHRRSHLNQDAILNLTTMATSMDTGQPHPTLIHLDSFLKATQTRQVSRIPRNPPTSKLAYIHINMKGQYIHKGFYTFHYFMAYTYELTC